MIHSSQINVGGVFEDETAHVILVDEIDIAVLLFSSCGTAKFGFQMALLIHRVTAWESIPKACARPLAE